MGDKLIRVAWYEHDCDWVSKYCEENHVAWAIVPESVLCKYRFATTSEEEA